MGNLTGTCGCQMVASPLLHLHSFPFYYITKVLVTWTATDLESITYLKIKIKPLILVEFVGQQFRNLPLKIKYIPTMIQNLNEFYLWFTYDTRHLTNLTIYWDVKALVFYLVLRKHVKIAICENLTYFLNKFVINVYISMYGLKL